MLKILLYAYSVGVRSSRQIAAKLETDVAFRVLGSGLFPDFRTINNFRSRHRQDFSSVFAQVVRIAQEAGLVKLGTLAIDGSKIKASASKHQAMSHERMKEEEKRLRHEIRKIVAAAEEQDRLEDEEFGPDLRGDELPVELSRRKSRLEKIRAAKKRLAERKAQEAREQDERKAAEAAREGRDPPRERPELRKHPIVETRAMQRKLRTARGRATYKKRKYLVEPVFGWIKQVLGFRQFSLRGLAKVRAEWDLACAAVNLRRMGARLEWR